MSKILHIFRLCILGVFWVSGTALAQLSGASIGQFQSCLSAMMPLGVEGLTEAEKVRFYDRMLIHGQWSRCAPANLRNQLSASNNSTVKKAASVGQIVRGVNTNNPYVLASGVASLPGAIHTTTSASPTLVDYMEQFRNISGIVQSVSAQARYRRILYPRRNYVSITSTTNTTNTTGTTTPPPHGKAKSIPKAILP